MYVYIFYIKDLIEIFSKKCHESVVSKYFFNIFQQFWKIFCEFWRPFCALSSVRTLTIVIRSDSEIINIYKCWGGSCSVLKSKSIALKDFLQGHLKVPLQKLSVEKSTMLYFNDNTTLFLKYCYLHISLRGTRRYFLRNVMCIYLIDYLQQALQTPNYYPWRD